MAENALSIISRTLRVLYFAEIASVLRGEKIVPVNSESIAAIADEAPCAGV